jgi:hypothetical protein
MLNHRTRLRSRGNTQAQGRHDRKAAPETQGLLGIAVTAETHRTRHQKITKSYGLRPLPSFQAGSKRAFDPRLWVYLAVWLTGWPLPCRG